MNLLNIQCVCVRLKVYACVFNYISQNYISEDSYICYKQFEIDIGFIKGNLSISQVL